jgi:CheY-like chemotaxis protein
MNINGEILIIDDDQDDREFLKDIFDSLEYTNEIVFFSDATKVIDYLSQNSIKPFLILSDINMPKLNGYELRDQILSDDAISQKCVPYIFLSTSKNPENIIKAYRYSIQGYFKKEGDFKIYKEMIRNIVEYWRNSLTPNLY